MTLITAPNTSSRKAMLATALATLIGLAGGYFGGTELASVNDTRELCELDPNFCEPCGGGSSLPPCPTGNAGWLCCSRSSGVCVVADVSCSGEGIVLGWCGNYTVNGTVATCHDEQ